MATSPGPGGSGRPEVEPMGAGLSVFISIATWAVPTLGLALIGAGIGILIGSPIGIVAFLTLVWTGVFIGAGFFQMQQQDWKLMERFGRYHSVKLSGLRWKNFVFDRVRATGSLRARPHPLYKNDEEAEIDFTDITAPILAVAYYSVVDPAYSGAGFIEEKKLQIARFVYCYEEPYERIADIIDGELRPIIQSYDHEHVQKNGEKLCEIAIANSRDGMRELGAYPAEKEALIIKDIKVPPEIQTMREKVYDGEKTAEAEQRRLSGPARAVKAIKAELEPGTTQGQAMDLLLETMRLEALGRTGANITIYGPTLGDVAQAVSGKKGS